MERRIQERIPVRSLEEYRISRSYPYQVVNISKVGCSVTSSVPLGTIDSMIHLDVPLPGRADSLKLAARIVWEKEEPEGAEDTGYRYGLCFQEMEKVCESILGAYLDFLNRDVQIAQLNQAIHNLRTVQEKLSVLIAYQERKKAPYVH